MVVRFERRVMGGALGCVDMGQHGGLRNKDGAQKWSWYSEEKMMIMV